jgi:hypothetical protein
MSAVEADPVMTQRPLLIDHFDRPDGPLMLKDIDPGQESRVANGVLSIPIPRMAKMARFEIDHDFSSLAGRRSAISFRALLPNNGRVHLHRWLALVIDAGGGQPPMAFEPSAAAAVMMSPMWQAGVRIEGLPIAGKEIFPRCRGIEGPYQVVITIDDTPAARAAHGSAVVTVMINGLEFATEPPFQLGERPRLAFQTYVTTPSKADAVAVIDDFSVSVAVP